MKRLTLPVVCLLFNMVCSAQHANIQISFVHPTSAAIELDIHARTLTQDLCKKSSASYAVPMNEPAMATQFISNFDSAGKVRSYSPYLSPGDDLHLTIDPLFKGSGITVSGKGSENNSPDIISFQFGGNLSSYDSLSRTASLPPSG